MAHTQLHLGAAAGDFCAQTTSLSVGHVTDSSAGLCEMLFVCFLALCLSYTTLSEPLDRQQEADRSVRIQLSLHVPSVDNDLQRRSTSLHQPS